jgi:hypothetical protein
MYCLLLTVAAMGSTAMAMADPDGTAGLTQANTMIRSYFQYGADILYAVGALVGLVGSLRVYNKWSHGEPDTTKAASNWFGACIFLVIVATVLKSFFGLT